MSWSERTPDGIHNVHRRTMPDIDRAWAFVQHVHEADAAVWPSDTVSPMVLDGGLVVGSAGGHGPVRYRVSAVDAERIGFTMIGNDLRGHHEFRREGTALVHELVLSRPGWFVRVFVVPQHDVVIEDLFDNVEDLLASRTPPRERSRRPLVAGTLLRVT